MTETWRKSLVFSIPGISLYCPEVIMATFYLQIHTSSLSHLYNSIPCGDFVNVFDKSQKLFVYSRLQLVRLNDSGRRFYPFASPVFLPVSMQISNKDFLVIYLLTSPPIVVSDVLGNSSVIFPGWCMI